MSDGYQVLSLDDLERLTSTDGELTLLPLRRTIGFHPFGVNAWLGANAGDRVIERHREQDGDEELYVVVRGRATFTLGDDTLDAPAGTVVFVRDVDLKRHARADEPETTVLAIGGPRGAAYEPSAWEDCFAAERHRTAGDYDAYHDELEAALARRPDHPAVLYHLACAEALLGRADDAVVLLRQALELRPELAEHASADEDFAALRERPDWPLA